MTYEEFASALAGFSTLPKEEAERMLTIAEELTNEERQQFHDEVASRNEQLQKQYEEAGSYISGIEGDVSKMKKAVVAAEQYMSHQEDESQLQELESEINS